MSVVINNVKTNWDTKLSIRDLYIYLQFLGTHLPFISCLLLLPAYR